MFFDVILWDSVGLPYTLDTEVGVGGSEHAVIRLGNALKDAAKSVLLAGPGTQGLEEYKVECGALIVVRTSTVPNIPHRKLIVWAHDSHVAANPDEDHALVCLSEWQAFNMSGRHSLVIPGMLPEAVYLMTRPPRQHGRWLYASGAGKGWQETYKAWKQIRLPGEHLRVIASGYDTAERFDDPTVTYLEPLYDFELVDEICRAEGLFAVNVKPEVWPATLAMADALGTPVFVYAENEVGGSHEVLTSGGVTRSSDTFRDYKTRDFRISTVLPMWLELLAS